ncbi:MAG: ribosome assembly RNA-binding protein YhbY [Gammaproteobacteria bacterium]|nr:ribosome assembly RNA-binding protein YhbY [Gammaproteobacteria bacterium]
MDNRTLKQLRALAHHLKPVIWLGQNGYTASVAKEIDLALDRHQLIKLKLGGQDKESRQALSIELADAHSATVVQLIGATVTLYRPNPEKPNVLTG